MRRSRDVKGVKQLKRMKGPTGGGSAAAPAMAGVDGRTVRLRLTGPHGRPKRACQSEPRGPSIRTGRASMDVCQQGLLHGLQCLH